MITPIYYARIDLKKLSDNATKTTGTCNVGPEILNAANKLIYTILPYIADADLIGIERQLSVNVNCTKVFQHFISSFLMLIDFGKINNKVIFFDIYSKLKYTALGCPTELNEDHKKRWGISKAKELLQKRGDILGHTMNYVIIRVNQKQKPMIWLMW